MSSVRKICFRCNKIILDNENYFKFSEFKSSKKIKIDYAHKKFWDNFLKKVIDTTEAMSIVRGLKGKLSKMGMLSDEEVVVKC